MEITVGLVKDKPLQTNYSVP